MRTATALAATTLLAAAAVAKIPDGYIAFGAFGVPYDPHQSLVARFWPTRAKNLDEPRPRTGVDPRLQALVAPAMSTPDEAACAPVYAEIQALMDSEALVVPLYSPQRVALRTAAVAGIGLGIDVYHVDLTSLRRVAAC